MMKRALVNDGTGEFTTGNARCMLCMIVTNLKTLFRKAFRLILTHAPSRN